MVISASPTPPATASMPPPPVAAMPMNELVMPIVVPRRPTNGAVAPMVASAERWRFNSEAMASCWRVTVRSADSIARSANTGSASSGATRCQRLAEDPPERRRRVLVRQGDGVVDAVLRQGASEHGRQDPVGARASGAAAAT